MFACSALNNETTCGYNFIVSISTFILPFNIVCYLIYAYVSLGTQLHTQHILTEVKVCYK